MKVINMEELKKISKELEDLQSRVVDCIVLENQEINSEDDIYSQIGGIIDSIECIEDEVKENES